MNLLDLFIKIAVQDEATPKLNDFSSFAITKAQLMADAIKGAVSTAINAIQSVVGGALEQFGKYEQNVGGIETFFGKAADSVIANAKNAYTTAGMSANEYMSNVSSFAMTLVNSVARDRQQAAKGDTEAQKAELDKQYADLQQYCSDYYDEQERLYNDDIDLLKREQADHKTEIKRTLDDELDAKRTSYKDAVDNLKDALGDEVDEFKRATDDKIKEINREYTEKLKLVDEEKYNAIKAIEDEIDALNGQTKAERKALEEQNNQRRLAELQDRIARAENDEERAKATQDYNDLVASIEQKAREEQRSEQIESLRKQKDEVNEHYSNLTASIKEEQATVTENYRTERAAEQKVMEENNAAQVAAAQEYYDGLIQQQQRANEDYLKEVDRANDEEVKTAERYRDQNLKEIKAHNAEMLEEAKASVEAQKAELDGIGEIIEITSEDQRRAAELADMAMTDMADNANKMGSSMESIEYAYQGFAKSNFTMLDNLKLGYGGTKEEMERLLTDAENVSAKYGEVRDFSVDSFADIVEAIHLVEVENGIAGVSVDDLKAKMADNDFTLQELNKLGKAWAGDGEDTDSVEGNIERARSKLEEMGGEVENFNVLLGTTAKEGMTTYEGALGRVRAAWENWLVAITDPEGNPAEETEILMTEVGNAAALIIPRVIDILTTLAEEVGKRAPEIWGTFKTALEDSMTDEQKQKFEDFKTTIDNITTAASILAEGIKAVTNVITWAGGEIEGIQATFQGFKDFIGLVPGLIQDALGDRTMLEGNGKAIMEGFTKAASYEWDWEGKGFFANLAGWIKANKGPVEEDRKLLQPAGEAIMKGLHEGASGSKWAEVQKFFSGIKGNVTGGFSGSDRWLSESGRSIVNGLSGGIKSVWTSVESVFSNARTNFTSPFNGAASWLTSSGSSIVNGLMSGINSNVGSITSSIEKVAQTIPKAFNNAGNWLVNAGKNIITGFYNGLAHQWNNGGIKSLISSIATWIAEHKGPESKDRNLLVPAGRWIMGGLESGLRESFERDVMPFVESMADEMERGFGNPQLSAYASAVTHGVSGIGNSRQQQAPVQVTTILELDRVQFGRLVYQLNNDETQRMGVALAGGYS